jgi:hypothetical protein
MSPSATNLRAPLPQAKAERQSRAPWPSAPELGTNAWDKRLTDGLTSAPAERLGVA